MKLYGITKERFHEIYDQQNGCCKLCGIHELKISNSILNVDHCHTSGKVRGLLCHKCNHGIGLFNDDIALLEKAIQYLKENT
jgi:hypothetical protein